MILKIDDWVFDIDVKIVEIDGRKVILGGTSE